MAFPSLKQRKMLMILIQIFGRGVEAAGNPIIRTLTSGFLKVRI